MSISNKVLRTVYLKPAIDDAIREEALRRKITRNELISKYLEKGMEIERSKAKVKSNTR